MDDPSVAPTDIDEYCDKLEDELARERVLSDRLAALVARATTSEGRLGPGWLESAHQTLTERRAMREGSSQESEA